MLFTQPAQVGRYTRTGSDNRSSRAVMSIDHTNSGIRSGFMLFGFMLIVVVIKFTAPRIDDTPAKCREKMARSTDAPTCAIPLANGGLILQLWISK
jgi:hypothetical protein